MGEWSRRAWLHRQAALLATLSLHRSWAPRLAPAWWPGRPAHPIASAAGVEPALPEALALRAVEAACAAGATYADTRLTRGVQHFYGMGGAAGQWTGFWDETETVGVGVRTLVNGCWGFAASPLWDTDDVVRLARAAVAQARVNAVGPVRPVELEPCPVVTGRWATPIAINPFTIPLEEILAAILHWKDCAQRGGGPLMGSGAYSYLQFDRQERVLATSAGSLVTQTLFEIQGNIICQVGDDDRLVGRVTGLAAAGQGWELFNNAQIPEQLATMKDRILAQAELNRQAKPLAVGRYTLVCDGATMAALVAATLGVATQLDRALGYEANATGTSFLDEPLAMVGTLQVTAPGVTVTANRSDPAGLATVQWDDEGVEPPPCTLIQDGILTDFQTTREQAAWLAPYYQAHGRSMRSNGCAAAEDAHAITMQHMPNLSLEPSASATRLEALVADVPDGILIEGGFITACDAQARTGLLCVANQAGSQMRQITRGTLGRVLRGGALQFDTQDLWHHVLAMGGAPTQAVLASSQYDNSRVDKGQPPQATSHSVRAVAATITNQPMIVWGERG